MNFKFKTLSMLAALAVVGLASCSSEEPLGNDNNLVGEGEGIGYMAFTISTDYGTRAEEDEEFNGNYSDTGKTEGDDEVFSDGDTQEYAICPNGNANVALFYYGDNDDWYGYSYLQPFDSENTSSLPGGHVSEEKYPEHFYTYVSRSRNVNPDIKPDKVLVLLNVDPGVLGKFIGTVQNNNINVALEKTANNNTDKFGVYIYNNKNFFTMTNSAFVDGENAPNVTPIEGKVYETPEEALENRVTVFVERVLSKFELTFGEKGNFLTSDKYLMITPNREKGDVPMINYVRDYDGKSDYPTYERHSWKIYVANWGINAVEPESRYFKNINPNATDDMYFKGWNSNTLHRSYWAETENYANNERNQFPTQYRDASDDPEYNSKDFDGKTLSDIYWGKGQTNVETALTYYSFNHFKAIGRYKYAPERTYNAAMGLEGYGPYRFASHYLIGGHLIIAGADKDFYDLDDEGKQTGAILTDKITDKWAAYNYYFGNEESYIRYAFRRMIHTLADGREHTVNGKTFQLNNEEIALLAGSQRIRVNGENAEKYFETKPANIVHGDGKVVLTPKNGVQLSYRDKDGNVHVLSNEDLQALIYNFTDAASHFNKGMMYYAIPVQHKLGKSGGETVAVEKNGKDYKVGQFGTVRNHWYTLKVKNIGNIGTPVDDPDQPIIPDPEDDYNIALEIVVLPWHKIDNGEVDL